MNDMAEVHERDDGRFCVTLVLSNRWEVWRLADFLSAAAERRSATQKEAGRWRRASRDLKRYLDITKKEPEPYRGRRIQRPPSAHVNEPDMEQVLRGKAPFPVLSIRDMRAVYPQLEARGKLSARDIAEMLYVSHRTVGRWRAKRRQEGERQS